ncbi:helix-turn-helix transcriptional regulator [Blautia producta]|nr:helix-turn-helix transcriptional regulator [Blautia producta]NSG14935.1 helix-turn-helix transcriptional regulator [Blautia producta]NSJ75126.1 helix-turn-helix transcriptional regulator [Blautia producta]
MKTGELIRSLRKEKKLTQEQVADLLGVSAPAVNKWENGGSLR